MGSLGGLLSPSWSHGDQWYEHFLHGDAPMLEGVFVITHVVVIVVRIGEERVSRGKDIAGGEVRCR